MLKRITKTVTDKAYYIVDTKRSRTFSSSEFSQEEEEENSRTTVNMAFNIMSESKSYYNPFSILVEAAVQMREIELQNANNHNNIL